MVAGEGTGHMARLNRSLGPKSEAQSLSAPGRSVCLLGDAERDCHGKQSQARRLGRGQG